MVIREAAVTGLKSNLKKVKGLIPKSKKLIQHALIPPTNDRLEISRAASSSTKISLHLPLNLKKAGKKQAVNLPDLSNASNEPKEGWLKRISRFSKKDPKPTTTSPYNLSTESLTNEIQDSNKKTVFPNLNHAVSSTNVTGGPIRPILRSFKPNTSLLGLDRLEESGHITPVSTSSSLSINSSTSLPNQRSSSATSVTSAPYSFRCEAANELYKHLQGSKAKMPKKMPKMDSKLAKRGSVKGEIVGGSTSPIPQNSNETLPKPQSSGIRRAPKLSTVSAHDKRKPFSDSDFPGPYIPLLAKREPSRKPANLNSLEGGSTPSISIPKKPTPEYDPYNEKNYAQVRERLTSNQTQQTVNPPIQRKPVPPKDEKSASPSANAPATTITIQSHYSTPASRRDELEATRTTLADCKKFLGHKKPNESAAERRKRAQKVAANRAESEGFPTKTSSALRRERTERAAANRAKAGEPPINRPRKKRPKNVSFKTAPNTPRFETAPSTPPKPKVPTTYPAPPVTPKDHEGEGFAPNELLQKLQSLENVPIS